MSSQPSWRPNLPESRLFDEKTWLQGATLSAVAYGVNLALFTLIISLLSTRLKGDVKHNGRASRRTICLMTYVCVMFILSTLSKASQAEMTQLSFIENRNFPGGPAAYQESMFSIPISRLAYYCLCMMNWFSDSLLLWRCLVVYGSSRTSTMWLVMAIPGLGLLASFITGTILLVRLSQVSSSPWAETAFIPDMIYTTTTISLNIILSLMIIIRLCIHRRRFTKLLGRRHAAHYTSIISMIIESAAVMAVVFVWFLIPFAMGNQLANIPMLFTVQVQAVASFMIIFRVAKGTAWTSQTADSEFTIPDLPEHQGVLSNIQFQTASVEHSADCPATSRSQNQLPLDGLPNQITAAPVYESPLRGPAGVIEGSRPNEDRIGCVSY